MSQSACQSRLASLNQYARESLNCARYSCQQEGAAGNPVAPVGSVEQGAAVLESAIGTAIGKALGCAMFGGVNCPQRPQTQDNPDARVSVLPHVILLPVASPMVLPSDA